MRDIPQIIEDLYNETVKIPDEKEWPAYLGSNSQLIHSLYAFYYGLRAGFQLSNALREKDISPSAE